MTTDPSAEIGPLIDRLVMANHILYDQGVVDGFGHVSARNPVQPDRFFLSRSKAPADVTRDDILEFDAEGECVNRSERVYLERFIHSEIYRARPDVNSIVHSHSHSIVPFSTSREARLRPLCHMAGFIGSEAPIFEIRDEFGEETDLLIRDPVRGRALARSIGDYSIVLMRGHGSTVVADSIEKAVFRAVYAELNARLQMNAATLGEITFLTGAEADECAKVNESQVSRPWDLWSRRVLEARGCDSK
jgi:ribulose-5-phosphate 4-epimerase/fuculose-1-phosphate aldolase